jgi:hypothetical protein
MKKITIGLPVYNSARYLAAAIDSILAQSYGDFDLLISDNASTDRTEEICRDYAKRDPRIRYIRQSQKCRGRRQPQPVGPDDRQSVFQVGCARRPPGTRLSRGLRRRSRSRPTAVLASPALMLIDEAVSVAMG